MPGHQQRLPVLCSPSRRLFFHFERHGQPHVVPDPLPCPGCNGSHSGLARLLAGAFGLVGWRVTLQAEP